MTALKMTNELVKNAWDNNHYRQFLHAFSFHKRKPVRMLEKLNKTTYNNFLCPLHSLKCI